MIVKGKRNKRIRNRRGIMVKEKKKKNKKWKEQKQSKKRIN